MISSHVTYIESSIGTNNHQQLQNFNYIIPQGLSLLINSTYSFLDLILAKLLVRCHPLLVSALEPSQKFVLNIALTSPSLLVVILSNSPQLISAIQSSLLPLGRLKQQYKCPKHSKLLPTNLLLHRQCADISGELG